MATFLGVSGHGGGEDIIFHLPEKQFLTAPNQSEYHRTAVIWITHAADLLAVGGGRGEEAGGGSHGCLQAGGKKILLKR